MISIFRRALSSKIMLAILTLILVAFVVTSFDLTGLGAPAGAGRTLATVGDAKVGDVDALRRVQNQFEIARQQAPELDMAAFVAQGGAERTIDQMINGEAMAAFAKAHGLVASPALVDGIIAGIPAFSGPNGKFDESNFNAVLQQRRLTKAQVRGDFERDIITKLLLTPVAAAPQLPQGVIDRYAGLLMETRSGQIGVVPSAAFVSTAPIADAELTTFYTRNVARYTVPERRVIKYALFDRSRFAAKLVPSEAEIAAAYKANAARYAGRQMRAFTQVIVQSQADAQGLLNRVRGGTAIAAAAAALGLEPLPVALTDKAGFAKLTSNAVADAAFAGPEGGFAILTRSGLGFHVVRIDDIVDVPARPLAQVRDELVAGLTKTKVEAGIADFVATLDEAISDGATFDDVVRANGLAGAATPPITAGGINPADPAYKLPPELGAAMRDAFQGDVGDDAQVGTVGDGAYALYQLDRIVPAAAPPFAAIRQQVIADAQIDRAVKAARRVADAVAAALGKGTPFAQALAATGVRLPPPQPARGTRIQAMQGQNQMPPPLMEMFSMTAKRAQVKPIDGNVGWYIVWLDSITPGDPAQAQQFLEPVRTQLTQVAGDEYAQQFVNAIAAEVGVTRDAGAIAAFKRSLTGAPSR
ncbi:MAG: SurA N-terminal domain-containing protein [Sphingomonadaceae bacterium]